MCAGRALQQVGLSCQCEASLRKGVLGGTLGVKRSSSCLVVRSAFARGGSGAIDGDVEMIEHPLPRR